MNGPTAAAAQQTYRSISLLARVFKHYMFCPPWTDKREPVQCFEGEASATAWELHQEFKRAVIANAPWEGGTLSGTKIREWIADRSREIQI